MRQRTILATTSLATLLAACANSPPPPITSSVTVAVTPLGVGAVAYDVKLYEQSTDDARSFVQVAAQLNQAPTTADGAYTASLPCHVLPAGTVGLIDVIAHLPSVDGAIADQVQPDIGEVDPNDLTASVGAQMQLSRNARPFVCADGQAVQVAFAMAVAARSDDNPGLSSMTVPLAGETLAMNVTTSDARVATTALDVTTPQLPDIYAFGFADTPLLDLHQVDATSGPAARHFTADWQLPATGMPYSLAAFATLFAPGEVLQSGGSAYVWGAGREAKDPADWELVDTFRILEAGRVTDGAQHVNVGAIINCRTAQIAAYDGTGVNLIYSQNVSTGAMNNATPIYYLHLVDGKPVPAQSIGVIESESAEFVLLLHEVATPTTVFAARCGFGRADGKGGLTGACDETTLGSGILREYSLAEIAGAH